MAINYIQNGTNTHMWVNDRLVPKKDVSVDITSTGEDNNTINLYVGREVVFAKINLAELYCYGVEIQTGEEQDPENQDVIGSIDNLKSILHKILKQ